MDNTRKINIGEAANDGNGETLRSAAIKINSNFEDLYSKIGEDATFTFVNSITAGTGVSVSNEGIGDLTITNTSPYIPSFLRVSATGQTSLNAASNQVLTVAGGGITTVTTNPVNNTLTITSTQVQADWDAVSGTAAILNKPEIPVVVPQIQADWSQNDDQAVDYIKNRPMVPFDISQLTDETYVLGGNHYQNIGSSNVVEPGASTVIYTSTSGENASGIKAIIRVAGPIGGTTIQMQMSEMLIARTSMVAGVSQVASTVYGNVRTTDALLATFVAQWNPGTVEGQGFIEIVATNLSSVPGEVLYTKVVATELRDIV